MSMNKLPKVVLVGMMTLVGWVSYGSGTVETTTTQGLTLTRPVEDETSARYLGDIEMGEDWDADNPVKRKDGAYRPGKLEDGVWEWDYVPKKESQKGSIDLTDVEELNDL